MDHHFYYVNEEISSDGEGEVATERQSIRKQLDFTVEDYEERRAINNQRNILCRSKSDMFFVEP